MQTHKKILVILVMLLILISTAVLTSTAQGLKEYHYQLLQTKIYINPDSTLDVEEYITYQFTGNYHVAWREIPLSKIDGVDNISVYDLTNNTPLTYSSSRLKGADTDAGYYTYLKEGGNKIIEWYYNLTNTSHTWLIKYKVHGAIQFNKNQDRLYWNIFTNFSVPVENSLVEVRLPQNIPANQTKVTAYRQFSRPLQYSYNERNKTFYFTASNFVASESFTIDCAWSKGLISESAYWRDWFSFYWGFILSVLIVVLSLLAGLLKWLIMEKWPKGRGVIIPQYEPPQNLPPAMAEIVCREKLTNRGLAATIIDLANKGYLTINDNRTYSSWLEKMIGSVVKKNPYTLQKKLSPPDNGSLHNYEKELLNILFASGDSLSLNDLQKHQSQARAFAKKIKELKNNIYQEVDLDTKAFQSSIAKEKKIGAKILAAMTFIIVFLLQMSDLAIDFISWFSGAQVLVLILTIIFTTLGLIRWFLYEAVLSPQGRILKEDWLGFKMFLYHAERFRLQNLTPQTFEKYLPYAMIFGIEKQWANSFASLMVPLGNPAWYNNSSNTTAAPTHNFSPSSFSRSFTSSFTKIFTSANKGSGGGWGGGFAGGGGGGGGGGAR